MIKISDLGLGKDIDLAQPVKCNDEDCKKCTHKNDCNPKIMAKNFDSKEDVIGFAINIANEWDCPHTFIFIKFKDNECAIGFHEMVEELDGEDEYDWNVYKIQWNDIKKFRQYIAEIAEIHFAVVLEEDKNGDFSIITK